jgi:pimeloyl-ACP methyl ester carboxylesterase
VGVATAATALQAGAWFGAARRRLETLLGAQLDRRRPGPPDRWSRRRWRPLLAPAAPDHEAWWAVERIGSSGRLAAATLATLAIGAPVLAVGLAASWFAPSAELARAGLSMCAVGSILVAVAATLAAPLVQAIRRREAIALRNVVSEPVQSVRWLPVAPALVALGCLLFSGLQFVEAPADSSCVVLGFQCVEIVVPADRAAADPRGPTVTVRFVVHRGTTSDPRLLVVAVGGPGASGLAEAPSRLESFDERILEGFDVVFFDQRGTGDSGGVDCEAAATAYGRAAADDPGAARIFVGDCLREAGVPGDDLDRYRTAQVVDDLEALRAHLGHDDLVLYGESYGTELAQAYAAAHPDRIEALVLDAPVDPALDAHDFWRLAAEGFEESLQATLRACTGDPDCRHDLPDPTATYRRILARLRQGPVKVSYPHADGGTVEDEITTTSLERGIGSMLYTEAGRMIVQRALAEVERGEWQSLGRMAGSQWSAIDDPTFSEFTYYAVTCGDARFSPSAVDDDVAAYLERARAAGIAEAGFASTYFVGLPCLYWPAQPAADPPAPTLEAAGFPVLVLTATADPITRAASARAIVARIPNAWLVETTGGPHVTFGVGNDCADDRVIDFLVDGRPPAAEIVTCSGAVADPFLPLTALDADEYGDALEAMSAVDTELYAAPEYYAWQGFEPLEFGCRFAGRARVDFDADSFRITLVDCEFARGLPIDGTGSVDPETGDVDLTVKVPRGELTYRYEGGRRSVEGTWKGEPVDLRD